MEISVETTNSLERKMTIEVPSAEVDSAVNERLREAARNVRLNGFRKGKVPMKVIKNRFGKGVRQEVIGELMNRSYYEALHEKSIRPASQPRIEAADSKEGEDLKFTAVFEVYPEVELPEFSTLEVERLVADVTEDDIDKMIETLREQRQDWQEADREAATGDLVNIDYSGSKDGEKFEGGQASGANLELGSNRMIPGFEDGLVGKKAGDETTLSLTFPEQYHNQELAGKAVEFEVKVNKVSERVKPELDDEFFASFGIEEGGVEAFREEVSKNMEREMKTASRSKLKNQILDALLAACELDVPQSLIDNEIGNLRQQAMQQMGGAASQNLDPSLLPDDLFREQARRRVTSGLMLGEVINAEKLTADPALVREEVEEIASTYEAPEDVINWYYSNQDQLATVESSVLEDQVFDHIVEKAKVTDKTVSYEDVIRTDPPAAGGKSDPQQVDKE